MASPTRICIMCMVPAITVVDKISLPSLPTEFPKNEVEKIKQKAKLIHWPIPLL